MVNGGCPTAFLTQSSPKLRTKPCQTSTKEKTTIYSDFASETEVLESFPYCQIISPPNLKPNALEKTDFKFGIFIPKIQAEAAEFTPDENWVEHTEEFGTGDDAIVEGYITNSPRFVIIRRSKLEVQESQERGWRTVGVAYERGNGTKFLDYYKNDRDNYRLATRYLLLFVDENNKPLNPAAPIKLTAKGGFGAVFGIELGDYSKNLGKVFSIMAAKNGQKVKGKGLNHFALAHTIVDMEFRLPPFRCN